MAFDFFSPLAVRVGKPDANASAPVPQNVVAVDIANVLADQDMGTFVLDDVLAQGGGQSLGGTRRRIVSYAI